MSELVLPKFVCKCISLVLMERLGPSLLKGLARNSITDDIQHGVTKCRFLVIIWCLRKNMEFRIGDLVCIMESVVNPQVLLQMVWPNPKSLLLCFN